MRVTAFILVGLLVGCAVSPEDAVPDRATAIKIAREQCSYESENWRNVMRSGDYWVLLSDKLHEATIDKRDGMVVGCFSPGGIVTGH